MQCNNMKNLRCWISKMKLFLYVTVSSVLEFRIIAAHVNKAWYASERETYTVEIENTSNLQINSRNITLVARDSAEKICLIEAIGKKSLIPFDFGFEALRQIHSRWHDSFQKAASKISGP